MKISRQVEQVRVVSKDLEISAKELEILSYVKKHLNQIWGSAIAGFIMEEDAKDVTLEDIEDVLHAANFYNNK